MTDYLREVEESMRAEKFARLWQEHRRFFILACVALVIGTAAQSAWVSYNNAQNEKTTAQFLDAIKSENALTSLQKIGQGQGADAALANLSAGNLYIEKNDWGKAIAAYDLVAKDRHAPDTYRDLATVQRVALQLDHDDKANPDELLKVLAPLRDSKKSAWAARAILLTAIIQADKQKKYDQAIDTLKPLQADVTLPANFIAQISALAEIYALKGSSK